MDKDEASNGEILINDLPSIFTGNALKFLQAAQDPDLGF